MICLSCGAEIDEGALSCPECGAAFQAESAPAHSEWEETVTFVLRVLVHILIWVFSLCILGFGAYKAYYWHESNELQKLYLNGTMQIPELGAVTLPDGRSGHAITFFGQDGDVVYVEELSQKFMIIGGKAVIEVADSEWFQMVGGPASIAQIALTPILIGEGGGKTLLPIIAFDVEMPVSPLTIVSPTEKYVTTLSSVYALKMNVVYGSTVLVDGEDVTSMVDKLGNLTVNVAVYPRGENPISILVQTPNHLETREDLVFYRQAMDIELELAASTVFTSSVNAMTIRGAFDPAATFSVNSPYAAGTLETDEKGNFSFVAEFKRLGYNTVTIRASKPGYPDSVISFDVYYVPSLNEYSRSAWKMDYQQLLYCWDTWDGRIFLCKGPIVEVLSTDPNVVVIDVTGSNGYLVIENASDLPITEAGGSYAIYADVSGQAEYNGKTYTRLVGRYATKD